MAKFAPTATLDTPLDLIATATEMYATVSQPTTRANAITAALSTITVAGGDFAKSASGTGRKLTVAAKNGVAAVAGTPDHIALCTGTTLLFVTTCTGAAVTVGGTLNVATFDITDPQPV